MLIVGDSYRTSATTVVKSLFQQNFMSTFYYFMGFGQWLFWWMPRMPPAAGRLAANSSCSVDSCLAPGQRNVQIQSPPSIWTSWRMPQPVPSCRLPPTPASFVPPPLVTLRACLWNQPVASATDNLDRAKARPALRRDWAIKF